MKTIREFFTPSFGAQSPGEHRFLAPLRLSVASIYVIFAISGHFGPWRPLLVASVIAVPAFTAVIELIHHRLHRDPATEIKFYAFALPAHIATVMLAAATDPHDISPVPGLAVATILGSSTCYRAPYVVGLGIFASATAAAAHFVRGGWDNDPWPLIFLVVILMFAAGFSASLTEGSERLRRRLFAAQENDRVQRDSLHAALRSAQVSESRFRAFSDHAPAALVLFDGAGTPVFANARLEETTGVSIEDFAERAAGAGKFHAAMESALAGVPARIDMTFREDHLVSGLVFPIDGGAGAILFDVTRERAMNEQMARLQQMETLGTLAGGIAHDFNNLLTTILGNIYLAQTMLPGNREVAPLLDDARTAGERGADLVRRLLDYSRPGVEHVEPVSVAQLLEETVNLVRVGITPSIAINVECQDRALGVLGSFGSLQQVILNLLINARDAMPDGGSVSLRARRLSAGESLAAGLASGVVIEASDTGTGIPAEALPRIFDPFFTTKEVGKGTGLGLSTAVSIVRAHGGVLEVDTEVGSGTTFRLLLPGAPIESMRPLAEAV